MLHLDLWLKTSTTLLVGLLSNLGYPSFQPKQYTSTMGAMLKSSGISGDAVRDMSIEVTKLTADMASFII